MEKIFYTDPQIVDFTAHVTECVSAENGLYRVTLDRTAFFPEEGGQGPDRGLLAGAAVKDVQIQKDVIYHYVEIPFDEGMQVLGHVDWQKRFDYMQQHSGEHVLSGLFHKHYGLENVGFHLGDEEVTMDISGPLTGEQLSEIEQLANEIVWLDLPVKAYFPTPGELAALSYRSKLSLTENVRIVEIVGADRCACCAPHVSRTGQIGMIKIVNAQSHRGGMRLNILCGERAYRAFDRDRDSICALSALLSVKQEAVVDGVKRLQEESLRARLRANALQAKLLALQCEALPAPELVQNVVLFTGELDTIAVRNAVNELCIKYQGYCCIFSGEEGSYRYVIGSAGRDCREAAALLRSNLQAKGGGSAPMVQGSITASEDDIRALLENR